MRFAFPHPLAPSPAREARGNRGCSAKSDENHAFNSPRPHHGRGDLPTELSIYSEIQLLSWLGFALGFGCFAGFNRFLPHVAGGFEA